jgi:glycosyltransferase involved in cell wall biosynthesis
LRVHQVLVAAAPHDAVTNDALALRDALRSAADGPGASEVFAQYVHPALAGDVHPLGGMATVGADAFVYHVSIGEPAVTAAVLSRSEPLLVVYHNITPAAFLAPYDRALASRLASGRRELALLRPRTVRALADSEFNAAELRALGFPDVHVLPLVLDLDRRVGYANETTADAVLDGIVGPVFLFVGQLMPHKRPDLLVQAHHVVTTYLDPGAGLVLVGAARTPRYSRAVEQLASELAVPGLRMPGVVSDATLAALYGRADVFVTASEHEGFCIPIVEAMRLRTPVVARAMAAVPETSGGAALLLDPSDGPAVLAEAMYAAATDSDLRRDLMHRGSDRVAALGARDPRQAFVRHLEAALA